MSKQKETKSTRRQLIDELLDYHNKIVNEAKKILMSDETKACFENIVNTSGGNLVLPDFHALSIQPNSEAVFNMEPGERLNLLTMFDVKDINRNRKGLLNATKMKGVYGFPALTFIENIDVEFPFELKKETQFEKGLKMKEIGGSARIDCPANEFDDKLKKDLEKEKKHNDKIVNQATMLSGSNRKTKDELELEEIEKM